MALRDHRRQQDAVSSDERHWHRPRDNMFPIGRYPHCPLEWPCWALIQLGHAQLPLFPQRERPSLEGSAPTRTVHSAVLPLPWLRPGHEVSETDSDHGHQPPRLLQSPCRSAPISEEVLKDRGRGKVENCTPLPRHPIPAAVDRLRAIRQHSRLIVLASPKVLRNAQTDHIRIAAATPAPFSPR